jgi:hypothetical protein
MDTFFIDAISIKALLSKLFLKDEYFSLPKSSLGGKIKMGFSVTIFVVLISLYLQFQIPSFGGL